MLYGSKGVVYMGVKEKNMEQKVNNELKVKEERILNRQNSLSKLNYKKKLILIFSVCGLSALILILGLFNKESSVQVKVKSSLDRLVEKSDLETVNFTYNAIAKQCKDAENCNKKSNDINEFEYVISCKGTITAGIDFKNIRIDVDEDSKKLIVKMPEAGVTDINVGSLKFLNGEDLPASELANARKLCEETIKEKSEKDNELLPAAKEQAEVVLKSFYEQWFKSFDEEYKVEVK